MSSITVSSLHIHPVKSCSPISVSRSWIDQLGLTGDRRYLVTDLNGQFMTARKYPKMISLLATLTNGGLILSAQGYPTLELHESDFEAAYADATVWKQTVHSQRCGAKADAWMSEFLGTPCQLLFFGKETSRPIKDNNDKQVSFADGYPLLLTSQSSLAHIQSLCPEPIVMEQFRPNIVISGSGVFAEDTWSRIRIGDIIFSVHSPCERCKLITLPPRSTTFSPKQEPLRTLIAHHSSEKRAPLFGHNLIAQGTGIIEVGMPLEVLD